MSFTQKDEESPTSMPAHRQDRYDRRSDHDDEQQYDTQQRHRDRKRSPSDDEDEDEDIQPRWKRRRENYEEQWRPQQQKKDSDKITVVNLDAADFSTCNRAGRWAIRSVDLALGLKTVIQTGSKYQGKDLKLTDKTEINLRRAYEAFQASDSPFVQDYRELLKKNSGNKPVLDELLHKFQDAATGARSTDTHKIKDDLLALIQFDDRHRLSLPLPREKSELGFKYKETAFLSCPIDDIETFNESPRQYMNRVVGGLRRISWLELPAVLFDVEAHDPEEPLAAIFRGYFLLRVFLHIFCSTGIPGRLATYGKRPKNFVGVINNLSTVQPHHVAYTVLQACYAISDQKSWDLSVDSINLYFWVLEFFETPAFKTQSDEVLAFWTELYQDNCSHYKAPPVPDNVDTFIPAEGSTMARLMALKNAG